MDASIRSLHVGYGRQRAVAPALAASERREEAATSHVLIVRVTFGYPSMESAVRRYKTTVHATADDTRLELFMRMTGKCTIGIGLPLNDWLEGGLQVPGGGFASPRLPGPGCSPFRRAHSSAPGQTPRYPAD